MPHVNESAAPFSRQYVWQQIGNQTDHPLYKTWENMIRRCHSETHERFKDYGGRGITVCARWRSSFYAFLVDMGDRPDGLTLDRRDNDGNYEPSNCRWATLSEQQLNRRQRPRKEKPKREKKLRGVTEPIKQPELGCKDHELLRLLISGVSLKKSAQSLGMSQPGVSCRGKAIMKFMGVSNWMQVGVWYAKNFPERCS